jgi:hypothetical protein
MRKSVKFVLVMIVFLGALSAALFVLTRPSLRPIATWAQPDSLSYGQWGPYFLTVAEADPDWRGFPFETGHRYLIYIGLEAGRPTYGHSVDYSFNNGFEPLEEYILNSAVAWTAEGVAFSEPDGHMLFIPASAFAGGR